MGLSPEYYNECTQDVLNLYAEVEDRIIADIVRRIIKTGDITETAKWQIRQAQQMGLLYDDIIKEVAKSSGKAEQTIKKMFESAGVETVNNDNRLHIQAGKSPLDIRQSESMLQILNGVYKNSLTDLKNLTGTTAIASQTAYYQACNSAFMMVSSGAFSYQQALRTVIQEVADKGATVSYPSGHVDKLDVAVRRSLLTGIGLASRQISEENSKLCGCDLMEISAHSGARPSHASWQGQIVSLSGRRGYLSKSDIGYGTGAGFGGWNCRHDWYPYYDGISTRNYTQSDLNKLNAKDIEYQGKMYSEYEISQMLRGMERQSRALKRQKVALKTAIDEGQTFLKSDLTALNGKIRDKSAQIQSFCSETGYKRDRFRESINPKTSVGHASGSAQKYKEALKNGLTSNNSNDKAKSSSKFNISLDNFPSAFTSTPKGKKQTQIFIDMLQEYPNADEKVLKLYSSINKMSKLSINTNLNLKVSYTANNHAVNSSFNPFLKKLLSCELKIHPLDTKDSYKLGVNLHETMHFIDKLTRNEKSFGLSSNEKLHNAITISRNGISEEIQALINKFHAEVDFESEKVYNKYSTLIKNAIGDKKEQKRLEKEYYAEADKVSRSACGGCFDALEDIYDALSQGKHHASKKVKFGHGMKYYSSFDNQASEIIANYGQLKIMRPDLVELLKQDKPKLVEALDSLIDDMLKKVGD